MTRPTTDRPVRRTDSRGRIGALAAVVLAVAVITAGIAAPVAAQSEDDEDDEEDDGLSGIASRLLGGGATFAQATGAVIGGVISNIMYQAERVGDHDPARTPAECANDIQHEVNNHSTAYTDYINSRVNASTSLDVIEVRCALENDDGTVNTSTVFIVADVNSTSNTYENLTATTSTNRTADETITLSGRATEEGPDELVEFREEYVATNTTPPASYEPGLTARYGGYVHGTPEFLPPLSEAPGNGGEQT